MGSSGKVRLFASAASMVCCPAGCLLALLGIGACANELIHISDSTCSTAPDCDIHPSCAYTEDGCICMDGTCYYEPSAGPRPGAPGCRSCHGNPTNAAPPGSLHGDLLTSNLGVGAHQTHLGTSTLTRPMGCRACHRVPEALGSSGHIDDEDGQAELVWGNLAGAAGAIPSWDRERATCSNYCHGATLHDGTQVEPVWTGGAEQAGCGTCHGMPPLFEHPDNHQCELCHLPTAGPDQTIANPATHIDGIIQATALHCGACHGGDENAAPPVDVSGRSATTEVTVGAHQSHLSGGQFSAPVACDRCHDVPLPAADATDTTTTTHINGGAAEVLFDVIASPVGEASWQAPVCSNTACHNGPDATNPSPTWTRVDGTEAACGSCHGLPPATEAHQGIGDRGCSLCHLPTAGPNLTIANRATHVDGLLQATDVSCETCHGTLDNPAPPVDLTGDTHPTDREVGAHRMHLEGSSISAPTACLTCHLVPRAMHAPGHVDSDIPAELTWGGLAIAGGSNPRWQAQTRSCQNVYCHGAASSGGSRPEPVWHEPWPEPADSRCELCHGAPPQAPHPQLSACELCHGAVAGANLTIIDAGLHVNGEVEVQFDGSQCELCHGDASSAAPPQDLNGDTATTDLQVGAHRTHLNGTAQSAAVACSECHIEITDTSVDQAGHYDTLRPAEVTFGALARKNVSGQTQWNANTCSNTYCHGTTLAAADGTLMTPTWNGAALSCDACHGNPPNTPEHIGVNAGACSPCHADTMPTDSTWNSDRHVDGVIDVDATCGACHGGPGSSAPPKDLTGQNTSPQVGAHVAHLSPTIGAVVACETCHTVPSRYGDAGHVDSIDATPNRAEVTLTDNASSTYQLSTMQCGNTYCHGTTLPGADGSQLTPTWSGTIAACGACHAMPPTSTAHSAVNGPNSCNLCHDDTAGPNQTITNPALHIDGLVQASGGTCDSCHDGTTTAAAPPNDTSHAAHASTKGFDCAICHGHSGDGTAHDDGAITISFSSTVNFPGGTTMDNGGSATWVASTQTCAVGCHNPVVGNPPESPNLDTAVVWNSTSLSCVDCHDAVPTAAPLAHDIAALGDAACLECHASTPHMSGSAAMQPAFAYDGTPETLCRGCHDGSPGTYFGGKTAQDVSPYWKTSSHGADGLACAQCHTHHGQTLVTTSTSRFLDARSSTCLSAGCHEALASEFAQVPGGPISRHQIDATGAISIGCVDCHNAHLSQAHPLAAVNPDNRWQLMSLPSTAITKRRDAGGDYRGFCLKCHDSTAPSGVLGAENIAQTLVGGSEPTTFRKGSDSMHEEHDKWNCQACHGWHGTGGTSGINRGRLLPSWFDITQFNNGYSDIKSCGTAVPGGYSYQCH